MKKIAIISLFLAALTAAGMILPACESGTSYAELLDDENQAVNRFLLDHKVITNIPEDGIFEIGENAPYYQLDDEGNIYMQVLDPGTGAKAVDDQVIYFRFMRYNLMGYNGTMQGIAGEGNADNMAQQAESFRYNNYNDSKSSQWGSGIQYPLKWLNLGCDINLIIKSQYGWSSEIGNVQPYLYRIRYYPSML